MAENQTTATQVSQGKNAASPSPSPWETIATFGGFANEDERQWWQDSGALMARYLELCQYDQQQQYAYLLFLRNVVVPALGPYPPRPRAFLNAANIGLELSLNFQNTGNPTFRMTLDPTSTNSGGRMDPFNLRTVDKIVDQLSTMGLKGFDKVLYHRFMDEHIISDKQSEGIYQGMTANERITAAILAFDFKNGTVGPKEYFYPQMSSRASGTSIHNMLHRALSRLDDQMPTYSAAKLVMDYMETHNYVHEIAFFAWDFVEVSKSRLKIYASESDLSIAKVKELWTLAGKLQGATIERGFELVEQLWSVLKIGERKPWLPFLVNYEIKPGSSQPLPKVYFPVDDGNDLEIAQAITRWFELLGWHEKATTYIDNVRYLQPNRDISKTSGLQTLVSFSYKETGPYVTIYYHPLASFPSP